jgi:hypothetical protein
MRSIPDNKAIAVPWPAWKCAKHRSSAPCAWKVPSGHSMSVALSAIRRPIATPKTAIRNPIPTRTWQSVTNLSETTDACVGTTGEDSDPLSVITLVMLGRLRGMRPVLDAAARRAGRSGSQPVARGVLVSLDSFNTATRDYGWSPDEVETWWYTTLVGLLPR